MGKIVRNGIEFSSTSDTANNINYDNSQSGLSAVTTQEAIDELNNSLNNKTLWVKNLPLASPVEIDFTGCDKIAGYVNCNDGSVNYRMPFEIYKEYTDSAERGFYFTHYQSSSKFITMQILVSKSSITINKKENAGTWSNITGIVYGRAF